MSRHERNYSEAEIAALLDSDGQRWAHSVDGAPGTSHPVVSDHAPPVMRPPGMRTRTVPWVLAAAVVVIVAVSVSLTVRRMRGADVDTAGSSSTPSATSTNFTGSTPAAVLPPAGISTPSTPLTEVSETSSVTTTVSKTSPAVVRQSFSPAWMDRALDWPGEFRCGHPLYEISSLTAGLKATVTIGEHQWLSVRVTNTGTAHPKGYFATYVWVLDESGLVVGNGADLDGGRTLPGVGVDVAAGTSAVLGKPAGSIPTLHYCPVVGASQLTDPRLALHGTYRVVVELVIMLGSTDGPEPAWHVLSDPIEVTFK